MKIVPILLFFIAFSLSNFAQNSCSLSVTVTNFRSDKGQVCLTLFSSADGFYKDITKAKEAVVATIKDKKATYRFTNLPPGNYAIIALHDENKDTKMNTNMLGMPAEGFGVSRNAVGAFWQIKSFDEAKVVVNQKEVLTTFSIGY